MTKRTSLRAILGYWLGGGVITAVIAAIVSAFVWTEVRSTRETMEGGWTRTVYDDTTYLDVAGWGLLIALTIWTLGSIAYWLTEGK